MTADLTARQTIALCVRRCVRARDGRGPWQSVRSCTAALIRSGDEPAIALGAAEAAAAVGRVIAARASLWVIQ